MFRILNGQSKTITSAAFVLAIAALASRFLGFVRNALLANYFGAGDVVDAYYAAFRIPDLFFNILVVGALSAGFIPLFTRYFQEDPDKAWKLANNLVNITIVFLAAIAVILFFAAPAVMSVIVPGFSGEKLRLTIMLSRIMFLQPILLGFSAIFGGILQSFRRFLIYSLAPMFYNIGIIIGIIVFVPWFGLSGLAWGVVLGALLHWVVQIPATLSSGFRYKFFLDFGFSGTKKLALLMVPRTLSLAIYQINLLVITTIASTLADGSVAIFNFAKDLQYLPIGVFAISFATAAFPTLSSLSVKNSAREFTDVFWKTARKILFFLIPASILMILLRAQIVRVALGYGQFNWENTILTINTLALFSIGIVAHGLSPLLVRAFFAIQNTVYPLFAGFITVAANIILAFFLSKSMGVEGLALAFSIAAFLETSILFIILRLKIGKIGGKMILSGVLKFSMASLFAAASSYFMLRIINIFVDTHTVVGIFVQGLSASIVGVAVYILFVALLKCEEFYAIKKALLTKFWKSKLPEGHSIEGR